MYLRILPILIFSFFYFESISQDCKCQDEFVQICYYSADDICPPGNDCRFTLDGQYMNNGLREKLLNDDLFGPFGVVNCQMKLEKIKNVTSTEYLSDQKCDIIFVGVFSDSHFEPKTDLPIEELEIIKEWSVLCEKNLVIVSQFEASPWGYLMSDENLNPNTPDLLNSTSSIFDGPFGMVESFQQSGSYQGVISSTPSTLFDILGRDFNGKPTIVLDRETNDIILGDISILTQFGNLVLSPGNQILNDNDILAGNLFALGCGITDGTFTTSQTINLCGDETYTLPNGGVADAAGLYVDSLVTSGDCDSLIYTRIEENLNTEAMITYSGCKGDSFSIQIGSVVYDELNFSGTQTIQNSAGCDSLIMVDLEFITQDTTYLYYELCEGENIIVGEETYSGIVATNFIIAVENGCDSIVYLDVLTFELSDYSLDGPLIIDANEPFEFPFYFPEAQSISYEPSEAFSCQNCNAPNLINGMAPDTISISVIDMNGCDYFYSIIPTYTCTPHFANIINVNSQSKANRSFRKYSSCPLQDYRMEIFDRWGSKVYASNSESGEWDGTHKGKYVDSGVYIYSMSYVLLGEQKQIFGLVTVLR